MRSLVLVAVLALPAFAQQPGHPDLRFDSTPCHTWEGGLGAQGSFTRCQPQTIVVQAPPVVQTRVETRVERVEVPGPVVERCPPPVVRPTKPRPKPVQRCERWVPIK